MKVLYRQTASDDVVRQFRYYVVTVNLPEVAVRFRDAVRHTVQSLRLQYRDLVDWAARSRDAGELLPLPKEFQRHTCIRSTIKQDNELKQQLR